MQKKLEQLKTEAVLAIKAVKDQLRLTELENKYLGRKNGELTDLLKGLKDMEEGERKIVGQAANEVKIALVTELAKKKSELQASEWSVALEKERVDVTQPALPVKERGHLHPLSLVRNELEDFFTSLGFMVLDGPELESDYYNFEAVNIPKTHPARDSQDTFYIKGHEISSAVPWVMRTQTSTMQVRAMQKYGAPLRAIVPGKCFRNEATDARHEHTFYQLEGVVVGENINFSHLKGVMEAMLQHLYGAETKLRLRPKFFPFVEPGVNGEVSCFLCHGVGCRVCKQTGWLEILGAGMIHPNVLKEGEIDPKKYQGFAFGFGLDRLVMLKYGIENIRLLQEGNLRFLKQF